MKPSRSCAACALLLPLLVACEETRGPSSVQVTISDAGARASDDAAVTEVDAGPMRPDGGALLPDADVEIVLAHGGALATHPIEVTADLGLLDVVLLVDTTQSMQGAIDNLQTELRRFLIPQLRARVPMVSFAVASFQDFPRAPFGWDGLGSGEPDSPFRLHVAVTSDEAAVANAVARLDRPLGRGGDLPESSGEALFQVATGAGYKHDAETLIAPYDAKALEGGGDQGGVGFRASALRVVVLVTDAPSHLPSDYEPVFPGTHSTAQAAQALAGLGTHVVGIVSRNCSGAACEDPRSLYRATRDELEQLAVATGGVIAAGSGCATGLDGDEMPFVQGVCPLVFDVDAEGRGLSDALVDGIVALVDELRFAAVNAEANLDPLGFVQSVEAVSAVGAQSVATVDRFPASAPDGVVDTFLNVRSGSALRFAVRLRNDRIAPTEVAQRFRLSVRVMGDGLLLREQTLRIVVPPGTDASTAAPDGGTDATLGDGSDAG